MKNISSTTDVLIIGGGLAGIIAAQRLSDGGARVILIDNPLPDAADSLGGFAGFSGAKFSLPPAGMGLARAAGNVEKLNDITSRLLSTLGIDQHETNESVDLHSEEPEGVTFRKYKSILLTPSEVRHLLFKLSILSHKSAAILRAKATQLTRVGNSWEVSLKLHDNKTPTRISADAIFYAAGRLSEGLLIQAGARPQEGKGLDIGFRLEFVDKESVSRLRQLGPDAKILDGPCRTFCLNSPGQIYRYPFRNISIPGGIVADNSEKGANVGILMRVSNKKEKLQDILNKASGRHDQLLAESTLLRIQENRIEIPEVLADVLGIEETYTLARFVEKLKSTKLIDLKQPHRIHMPLLDWHWHTFANLSSHSTSLPSVYALGDSSGHARGLLQAAVSGWLAAEEYLCLT